MFEKRQMIKRRLILKIHKCTCTTYEIENSTNKMIKCAISNQQIITLVNIIIICGGLFILCLLHSVSVN